MSVWNQQKVYWEGITTLGVENVRTELRDLMKFIEEEEGGEARGMSNACWRTR